MGERLIFQTFISPPPRSLFGSLFSVLCATRFRHFSSTKLGKKKAPPQTATEREKERCCGSRHGRGKQERGKKKERGPSLRLVRARLSASFRPTHPLVQRTEVRERGFPPPDRRRWVRLHSFLLKIEDEFFSVWREVSLSPRKKESESGKRERKAKAPFLLAFLE